MTSAGSNRPNASISVLTFSGGNGSDAGSGSVSPRNSAIHFMPVLYRPTKKPASTDVWPVEIRSGLERAQRNRAKASSFSLLLGMKSSAQVAGFLRLHRVAVENDVRQILGTVCAAVAPDDVARGSGIELGALPQASKNLFSCLSAARPSASRYQRSLPSRVGELGPEGQGFVALMMTQGDQAFAAHQRAVVIGEFADERQHVKLC